MNPLTTSAMEIRDYTPLLKKAIEEAKAAGFESAARELEHSCFEVAFTTSSEVIHEHGLAIRRFLKATHGSLPRPIGEKMDACLTELGLVWPGWRRLVSLLRRRRDLRA